MSLWAIEAVVNVEKVACYRVCCNKPSCLEDNTESVGIVCSGLRYEPRIRTWIHLGNQHLRITRRITLMPKTRMLTTGRREAKWKSLSKKQIECVPFQFQRLWSWSLLPGTVLYIFVARTPANLSTISSETQTESLFPTSSYFRYEGGSYTASIRHLNCVIFPGFRRLSKLNCDTHIT